MTKFFLVATMILLLAGCEKEYSIEGIFSSAGTQGGTAVFTLDGAPGGCLGSQVQGTYRVGVATTAANIAILTVNVTVPGTYTITTNTAAGISFAGSGTFTTTGLQFIQMNATGTPTSAGTSVFLPGTNPCSFSVVVAANSGTGGSSGTAVYELGGAPGTCFSPIVNGSYTQGVALTPTNVVVLKANVTTIGTYNITATNNGMTFTATGSFTATGPNQNVTFTGSGTPTASGSINFQPGSGTNICTFTVPVTPASGGGGGGGGTIFLRATIDGVVTTFNTNLAGIDASTMTPGAVGVNGEQSSPAGVTADFDIQFLNSMGTITTGSFANPSFSNITRFVIGTYTNAASVTFSADPSAANSFTSTLSTLTATGATGTFQGRLKDVSGPTSVVITSGSFSITF